MQGDSPDAGECADGEEEVVNDGGAGEVAAGLRLPRESDSVVDERKLYAPAPIVLTAR